MQLQRKHGLFLIGVAVWNFITLGHVRQEPVRRPQLRRGPPGRLLDRALGADRRSTWSSAACSPRGA